MKQEDNSKPSLLSQTGLHWDKVIAEVEDHAILLLGPSGTILTWNKGAETIKGYTAQEAVGQNFRIFYPAPDQQDGLPEKLIDRAVRSGKAIHEGWRVRKNGSFFWGSVVISALHNEKGDVIGFSKVTRDLTERKFSEDLLKQKNEELQRMNLELASFAYVASHDLQAPLRKIQAFASQLDKSEKEKFSPRGQELVMRIHRNAERMQELIRDLLSYAQLSSEERKIESVDMNELLSGVKKDLEDTIAEKGALIEASPLPFITGIRFQLHQLVMNLLSNALKFSKPDERPHIVLTASVVKGSDIKLSFGESRKSYHHIAITDNGIGFDPEFSAKIFEVFQRLHSGTLYSGTGVGLAICKRILENHGGMILAESEANKGATFHVYLPAEVA